MKKIVLLVTLTSLSFSPAMSSRSDSEAPDGLRQRVTNTAPFLLGHRYPIPNLEPYEQDQQEVNPPCDGGGFFDPLMNVFRSIAESFSMTSITAWPVLTDDEDNERTITSLGAWADVEIQGDGLASNGAPLVTRTSTENRRSPKKALQSSQDTELESKLSPDPAVQVSSSAEENKNKFIDVLIQHPEYSFNEIAALLDTPEKCEIAFAQMAAREISKQKTTRGLNFVDKPDYILSEFIKFLSLNQESFPHLRVMMCGKHSLDPAQTAQLLSLMASRSMSTRKDGIFIDLTPGQAAKNHYLLVAIAVRFTQVYRNLSISIAGAKIPSGFEKIQRNENLKLTDFVTYDNDETESDLKKMKLIINKKKVTITYGNEKVLNLN